MRKSFTLIEVAVSVVLLFTIGLALSNIAQSNTDLLFKSKDITFGKFTFLAHDTSDFKYLEDYFKLKELPLEQEEAKKEKDDLYELSLPVSEMMGGDTLGLSTGDMPDMNFEIIGEKEIYRVGDSTIAVFRFK